VSVRFSDFLRRFIGHTLGATILPLAVCTAIGISASAVFNENKLVDYLNIGPTFLLPIAFGAFFAYLFTRNMSPITPALWVWSLPAVFLLWNIRSWRYQAIDSSWKDIWNKFFGTKCSSSECLYELITAAFMSSVAYALAVLVLSHSRRDAKISIDPAGSAP